MLFEKLFRMPNAIHKKIGMTPKAMPIFYLYDSQKVLRSIGVPPFQVPYTVPVTVNVTAPGMTVKAPVVGFWV